MVDYIGTARLRELMARTGSGRFIEELAGEIEADYRRWDDFEKSPRHAIHSSGGVIELMPTSDGRLYSFKYVNGHPKNTVKNLLTVTAFGVLAGVGSVLVFLPQILILFFFILLLEDSGYLPRAAFLLDRVMGSVGLSGRAFIPLLSSFACAIPGIMATRTIQNPRDRLSTIMIAPLMTCSARPRNFSRSRGFWVAIPTGQVSRWQTRIMMQPMTTSGAVANPNSSAPRSAAITTSRPVLS